MKVKEKDLVIGDEYYLDCSTFHTGVFVGFHGKDTVFYPLTVHPYAADTDGTVPFETLLDYEWEEA